MSKQRNKKTVVQAIIISTILMSLFSGCSMMAVRDYNHQVDKKLIEFRMANPSTPVVGFNTAGFTTGYLSAWKNDTGKMFMATVGDAAIAYGAYEIYSELKDQNDDDSQSGSVNVTLGDVNDTTTINIVVGDNSDSNNDENGTGSSNNDNDGE